MILDDVTKGQRSHVRNLLHEYSDVLSGKPNLTNVATHKIDTGRSSTIRSVPYRIPQRLEEEVSKEIEKMLEMGIVWAVELFRYYLYGHTFKLQTDHNPLVWLNQVRDKSRKLLRWSITPQEYDMVVEHKSGKQNCNVDALSKV